jgi:cytochrome c oxidase subunit 3
MVTVRSFKGHYSPEKRGVEVPGIYWHFVDIMWIFVFSSLYVVAAAGAEPPAVRG